MKSQKVNTVAIETMAGAISTANNNINQSFENLKTKGREMDNAWNSGAGSKAVTMMHDLFKGNEARSTVMENYVVFLRNVVNPGYNSAEEANTSLADQFL